MRAREGSEQPLLSRRPIEAAPGPEPRYRHVGICGLVVIGFFWVSGGIYGNEAMLMAGPPLYVFILLGIVPFVYSLPIALIVAELKSSQEGEGGRVLGRFSVAKVEDAPEERVHGGRDKGRAGGEQLAREAAERPPVDGLAARAREQQLGRNELGHARE